MKLRQAAVLMSMSAAPFEVGVFARLRRGWVLVGRRKFKAGEVDEVEDWVCERAAEGFGKGAKECRSTMVRPPNSVEQVLSELQGACN